MPQVLCGKRVTEFVKEVVLAVRTFRAAVAMLGDALSTIQFRPLCDRLDDHVRLCVGIAFGIWKNQLSWQSVTPLFHRLELLDQRSW
jgi:hypothetical protein